MKKLWLLCLLSWMGVFSFAQQQFSTLDSAVREAARYLEWRIPVNSAVAVIRIASDDEDWSKKAVDELIRHLVNNNQLRVVARDPDSQNLIDEELKRDIKEGKISDKAFISLGNQIGAQFLVSGFIEKRQSGGFRLRIQALSTETAQIKATEDFYFKDIEGPPEPPTLPRDVFRSLNPSDRVKVDYLIKQIADQSAAAIGEGDLYIQIGFKSYSNLVNIEEITKVVDLPPPAAMMPKNICFVIDISGSMSASIGAVSRLDWIKQALEIIINKKIEPQDFISLVVFSDASAIIFQEWQLKNDQDRKRCLEQIMSLNPGGGTVIAPALLEGYQLVEKTFRDNYLNRVVLLTDGESNDKDQVTGKSEDQDKVLRFIREYMNKEISTVSTIALAKNESFMTEVALRGGGISLFIDAYETPGILANRIGWLMAGTQEEIRKEVSSQVNVFLTPLPGVLFQDASPREQTSFSKDRIEYRLTAKDREYKTLWVKAQVSQGALKNGDILQVGIAGADEQGNPIIYEYPITLGLDPVQISTFQNIGVLSIYHAFQ